MLKKILLGLAGVVAVVLVGGALWLRSADRYQQDGMLTLSILAAPVRVVRDEQGIPYIYARTIDDAIRAQGFVTAQDRLFEIEFTRYLAYGRLAELIGEAGLKSDIPIRLAGLARHGRRHAALLGPEDRHFYELYLEGLNAYIRDRASEHQFGPGLLGMTPHPWTLEDEMTLQYFLSWSSSVNLQTELISQEILDRLGPERAAEIAQLTVNPDDDGQALQPAPAATTAVNLRVDSAWFARPQPREIGSNNWVMSAERSSSGAPVVVNDPHIDSRTLPGIWHPVGLITPDFRAVGAAGPGVPGLAVGRTSHIAFGVTNAYADVIDLFIESLDPGQPGNYLEGKRSFPFEVVDETLRIRDRGAPGGFREQPLRIRFTHRGPVISDHGMTVASGKVLSMRWSAPEAMAPDTGARAFFLARSVEEARVAIGRNTSPFNYVVADTAGNIGRFTAGRVPIRLRGDGSAPVPVVDGTDAWGGFIPWDRMPAAVNPARGWAGTANHRTVPADYPYAYSTYFAASWRYRRIKELLDPPGTFTPDQHWQFMRDTKNVMAALVTPAMSRALLAHADTRQLGEILAAWDYVDDPARPAPAIFQSVYRHFAERTFEDDLGPELTDRMLQSWYYWQERLLRLQKDNDNSWFDDSRTPERETRDDLFHLAALDALAELTPTLGPDVGRWQWGKIHTLTFFGPLIPGKLPAAILGGGTRPMAGSGETINRAIYRFDKPYDTATIASLRFVADLGDPDKVMAVLSGGASGRQFDPHLRDQVDAWFSGEPRYWWFSDGAIKAHGRHELMLTP